MMISVVANKRNDEFCEGLAYHSESDSLVVSSVTMDKNDKFYQNMIYMYKIERVNELESKICLVGTYKKCYPPSNYYNPYLYLIIHENKFGQLLLIAGELYTARMNI